MKMADSIHMVTQHSRDKKTASDERRSRVIELRQKWFPGARINYAEYSNEPYEVRPTFRVTLNSYEEFREAKSVEPKYSRVRYVLNFEL